MFWFKCGLFALPLTYILSLCSQLMKENQSLDTSLIFLYAASGAIVGKIIYDRFQQVHILGSLTPNPSMMGLTNKISAASASFLCMGFPVYLFMFLFKVDNYCLTALNICLCAFATLYMWMQSIITVYFSTLYFDKNVQAIRRCLATFASVVIVIMAIFGTISTFIPRESSTEKGVFTCLYITTLCSYILWAFFGIFVLTFENDYKHFAGEFRSEMLLNDEYSVENLTFPDTRNSYRPSPVRANRTLIKSAARHS